MSLLGKKKYRFEIDIPALGEEECRAKKSALNSLADLEVETLQLLVQIKQKSGAERKLLQNKNVILTLV